MKKQAVFLIVAAILVASVGWMFLGEQGEIDTAQAGTPLAEVKVPTLSKTALEGETIFNAILLRIWVIAWRCDVKGALIGAVNITRCGVDDLR